MSRDDGAHVSSYGLCAGFLYHFVRFFFRNVSFLCSALGSICFNLPFSECVSIVRSLWFSFLLIFWFQCYVDFLFNIPGNMSINIKFTLQ